MGEPNIGSKAFLAIGALLVAVIGIAALAAFFVSRDDATVHHSAGPGTPRTTAKPAVKPGNVLLRYSDERLTSDLRALAARVGGDPDPALEAAGQAVIVQRRPNQHVPVLALTATRALEAGGPGDPALEQFIEYWLGRAP